MDFSNDGDESMEQSALDLLSLAASHHHEQTPFEESAGGQQPVVEEDDGDRTEEEDLSLQLDPQLLPPLPLPDPAPVATPAPIPLDEPSPSTLPPLPTAVLTSLPPLPAPIPSPLPLPTVSPTASTSSAPLVIPHLVPEDSGIIRCVCPYTEDDGFTIQCDTCNVWQHANCVEINQEDVPEEYLCELCDAEGARKRGVDRVKAELMQRKRIEAEALRGVGAVEMGRSMSIGLSARGGYGRGGGRGGMAGSRKNSNNSGNQQDDSNGAGFHPSTSNNQPSGNNDVSMTGGDEHQSPVVKVDRRRRGNKHHLPTSSATSRSRPSASNVRQPSASSQPATTSQPLQPTTPAASTYSNDPSHQYFSNQNTHPHNSEDEGNELGAWGMGAGLGSDERYETWQYEYTPVEKNLWRESKVVDRFKWLLEQDDAGDFPKPETSDAASTLPGSTISTPGRQRTAAHNAALNSQVAHILDVAPISLTSLPEPAPIAVKPVPSPGSFLLLPPSASTFSSSSSQAPQCSYPAPTTYHVLSTNVIPPNTFIGALKGRITDLEAYRRDPVNQYDLLGLPKFNVRAIARPWSVAVDMRLWGCELRFARSGCHPNAVIKIVRVKKGAAEEEKAKSGDERAGGEIEVEAAEDLAGNLWTEQKAGNEVALDELTFAVYSLREIGKKEEIVLPWDWDDQHLIHLLPHLMSLSPNSPESPLPFALEDLSKKFSQVANTLLGVYQQCGCSGSNENKKNCCLFWLNKGSNVLKTAFVNSNSNFTKREPFSVLFLNALGAGTQGGDGRKKGQRGGKKVDLGALIGLERAWLEERPPKVVVEPEREVVKEEEQYEEDEEVMQVDEPAETTADDLNSAEPALPDLNEDSDDSDLTEPLSHPSDSEHNSSAAESEDEIVRKPIARKRLITGSRSSNDIGSARKKTRREESPEEVAFSTNDGASKKKARKRVISTGEDADHDDEDDTQGEKDEDEDSPPVASTSTPSHSLKPKTLPTTVVPGLTKEKSSVVVGRKKKPIKVIKRKTFEKRPPGPESTPSLANRGKVANIKSSITSSINKLKIKKDKGRERERERSSTPASTRTNSPALPSLPVQDRPVDSVAGIFEEKVIAEETVQRDVEVPEGLGKVDQQNEDVTMTDSTSAEPSAPSQPPPPPAPAKEPTPPPPEPEPEPPKPPVRARLSLAAYRQRQAQQPAEPAPSPAIVEPAPPLVETPQPMEEPVPQPTPTPALSVQASLSVVGGGSRPTSSSGPTSAFSTVSTEDMLKRLGDYFSSTATTAPPVPAVQRTFQQQAEGSNPFSSARPGPILSSQHSAYRRSPSPPSPPPSAYRERAREPSPIGYATIPKRSDVFRRPPSPPPGSQQSSGLGLDAEVPSSREYRRSSGSRWDAPAPPPADRRLSTYSPPLEGRRSPPPSQGASLFSTANQRPSPPVRPFDGPPLDAPTGPRGVPPSPPSQRGGFGRSLPFANSRLSPDLGSPSLGTPSLPNTSESSGRAPGPIPSGPRGFSGSSNSGAPSTPAATGRPSWPPRGGGPPFRGRGGRGSFSSPATTPGPSSRPHYDGIPTGPRTNPGPFRGRGGPPNPGWTPRGRGRGRGGQ